jgi:hypothetical protein
VGILFRSWGWAILITFMPFLMMLLGDTLFTSGRLFGEKMSLIASGVVALSAQGIALLALWLLSGVIDLLVRPMED